WTAPIARTAIAGRTICPDAGRRAGAEVSPPPEDKPQAASASTAAVRSPRARFEWADIAGELKSKCRSKKTGIVSVRRIVTSFRGVEVTVRQTTANQVDSRIVATEQQRGLQFYRRPLNHTLTVR